MHERELTLTRGPRPGGGHSLATRPATRSLVLWSGGVDSTYTLLRLLLETRDQVFSHHVALQGEEPGDVLHRRTGLESQAIDALRSRIVARARVFRHTVSRVAAGPSAPGGDAALLTFMAARTALALGFSVFDRILVGVNGDRDPGWHPDSAACALRRTRMSRAIRAAYGCDEVPQIYLWEPRPGRQDMLGYLGPELVSLTVSCRRPVAGEAGELEPCGCCARCRERVPESEGAVTTSVTANHANGATGHTRHPFRHLVESQSRRQESPAEAAASGPPGP